MRKGDKMTHRFNRGLMRLYHSKIDGYCKQGWRIIKRESFASRCSSTLVHPNGHRLQIAIDPCGGRLYEEVL